MSTPTPSGDNGRTTAGRFAPGNPGGPGNPYARRVAALRRALLEAATPERVAALAAMLMSKAEAGDLAACKLILPYLVGQPVAQIDLAGDLRTETVSGEEAVARLEAILARRAGRPAEE